MFFMEETNNVETNNVATKEKNTVALIGMIFSIVWLVLLITIIWIWFAIPLLIIWFILGIIWLFFKPRGKAWVAVLIPGCIFWAIFWCIAYLWGSIKAPAQEFTTWIEAQNEAKRFDNMNEDLFKAIANEEFNNIAEDLSWANFDEIFDATTWKNSIEKFGYIFFSIIQQGISNSLDTYEQQVQWLSEKDLQKLIDDSNAALNDEEAAEFPITLDITSESDSEVVSDAEPVEEIEEAVEDEDASNIEESGDEILE